MLSTLFFYLSKIVWALVAPASLLYLLLLAGCVQLFRGKLRAAKILLGVSTAAFTLIAFLPVGQWLATPLETRFAANPDLPRRVDGIIVLGGALDPLRSYIWDQPEFVGAADRYYAFAELAKQYRRADLVFTGGNGTIRDQAFKEADVATYVFENLGIDPDRLVMERDSRNTRENVVNSKALAKPEPGDTWVLITSAIHMPRAVGVFCEQDWPVIAYPVDHETAPGSQVRLTFNPAGNLQALNGAIREWVGLLAYDVTGKTDALLPAGCSPG